MIRLTRLRHAESFLLNPDFIERVDSHVDTVVRLTTGTEYLVEEPAEVILARIVAYRSSILAALPEAAHRSPDLATTAISATATTTGTTVLDRIDS
ncbi:flagellar FlbD family protein [Ilumatobacter sp.]|uniref:flagellar FlbD family protein n=1 Tax=Ilumatobacter sp. TaxID=1967498 RepID=UPI003B51D2B1